MKRKGTRIFALLLAAVLLLGGLPMQALAAEDEAGWFHLAADWNGELLIKPERVPIYGGTDDLRGHLRGWAYARPECGERDADRRRGRKLHPRR